MILILNCGSQSIKWKVFNKKLKLIKDGRKNAFSKFGFKRILKKELGSIKENINCVGHRVVHGGREFTEPTKITKEVFKKLKKLNKLAPLHNPYNILGIKVAQRVFPEVQNIAVFDTQFYKNLPNKSSLYPLPEYLTKTFKKFGFHGISHEYAAREAAEEMGLDFDKIKIISCHLGGGSSITAIKNGEAVDTSMGYTPMEGLMMMNRSGDIDPGIIIELGKKAKQILNYESGIKGVCGESDMLKVLKRKDKKAKLALEIFAYRIRKYIGAYFAILNGCDLLVFTGAIGSGDIRIRKMILDDLDIIKNVKIVAIKPNEELAIVKKILKEV